MSQISELFKSFGVNEDQIREIVNSLKENPMMALMQVQALNLAPEQVQSVVALVMSKPEAITEAALEFGLSGEDVDRIRQNFESSGDGENS